MEIFVINLRRSPDRRARMEARLRAVGLDFTIYSAIDAAAGEHLRFPNFDQGASRRHWRKTMSPGEVACFASHYCLWQLCVENGRPMVILEDDAIVGARFAEAMEVLPLALERFDYVRLSAFKERKTRPVEAPGLPAGWALARFAKGPLGMAGYAIAPAAAERLIAGAREWLEPADVYADHFWLHGVPCVALAPLSVWQDGSLSTIDARGERRAGLAWRLRRLARKTADNLERIAWIGTTGRRLYHASDRPDGWQ